MVAVKPTWSRLLLILVLCAIALSGGRHIESARAGSFSDGLDGEQTSWTVRYNKLDVRRMSQRRNRFIFHQGTASENFQFDVTARGAQVQIEHRLPPARVIDDLRLSIWMKSFRNGSVLALRVIFPHQKDPRTGDVLSTLIHGTRYSSAPNWQQLDCTTLKDQIQERLRLLRSRFKPTVIDARDIFVDQAVLIADLPPGTTEFFLDDIQFGPVVSPRDNSPILQLQREDDRDRDSAGPSVEFRLDRLLVDGRPFFPKMTPYHNEDLDQLKSSGLNLIWVPDYRNGELLRNLRARGMWAMATPTRAVSQSGSVLDAKAASLVPFSKTTSPVLAWYLGTRIPSNSREELLAWINQIRSADRRFRRPLMADVTGAERVYSRHLQMTGIGRHTLNTTFSPKSYRDWLSDKRKLARPGSFTWTWVQTEAASANQQRRRLAKQTPIVIEPEQIRLQVYAALAAGSRGIGYWKSTPLDAETPVAEERALAIAQLNLELELLEPWLSTGTVIDQIPFQVRRRNSKSPGQLGLSFRNSSLSRRERDALLHQRNVQLQRDARINGELEAAVLETNFGLLLLPVWYQDDAQFVPGKLVAHDATIVVPGVANTDSAWEVTTTKIENLNSERVAGGIKITLKKFDQTAAVVITSDRNLIAMLRRKMESMQAKSTRVTIKLAQRKLERVSLVDEELKALGVTQPDGPQLLAAARESLRQAEAVQRRLQPVQQRTGATYQGQDYDDARQWSLTAMQLLRILQRAHWNDTVRGLSSPASSEHSVCFQTLPEHWRLIERLGRSRVKVNPNLLPTGDFEGIDAKVMVEDGWRHEQANIPGIRAAAELALVSRQHNYCMRLVAVPENNADAPAIVDRAPVSVSTPPVHVERGQILHISGWVRVVTPITGSIDGVTVFDNIAGNVAALRWNEPRGWQRFEMLREIHQSRDLSVTLSLNGLGEVQFDNLKIIPHDPPPVVEPETTAEASEPVGTGENQSGALDFLQRLPKLNPLQPK